MALAGLIWLAVLQVGRDSTTTVATAERALPTVLVVSAGSQPEEVGQPEDGAPEDGAPGPGPDSENPEGAPPESDAPAPLEADPDAATELTDQPSILAPWVDFDSRVLLEFDLETGSAEFSAVALNEDLDRLLIADDANRVFEFALDATGQPVLPARRTLRIAVGGGDIEGMAWMEGTTYVIAHEDDGRLTVVDFDDEVTTVTAEHLQRSVDTGVREIDGNGLEGVAYIHSGVQGVEGEFVVVDERPPSFFVIDVDGFVSPGTLVDIGAPDISDVWVASTGALVVLSDEARLAAELSIDDDGNVAVLSSLPLSFADGRFEQPEGIVGSRDGTRLYVVSEAPGPGRFAFGLWRTTNPLPPE